MIATTPLSSPTVPGPVTYQLDPADRDQRIALATDADTCKGMFFTGLIQCVDRERGAVGLDALKREMGGKKYIDFFNYPIVEFLPLAWKTAALVSGVDTPAGLEHGIRTLGKQATRDFLASAVGRTLLMLAAEDPKRLMNSLATGYKTAVSYGQRTVTWQSSSACVFSMRRDFMPHPYHEGVLLQVLSALGVRPTVKGVRVGVLDTDYEVSWGKQ